MPGRAHSVLLSLFSDAVTQSCQGKKNLKEVPPKIFIIFRIKPLTAGTEVLSFNGQRAAGGGGNWVWSWSKILMGSWLRGAGLWQVLGSDMSHNQYSQDPPNPGVVKILPFHLFSIRYFKKIMSLETGNESIGVGKSLKRSFDWQMILITESQSPRIVWAGMDFKDHLFHPRAGTAFTRPG